MGRIRGLRCPVFSFDVEWRRWGGSPSRENEVNHLRGGDQVGGWTVPNETYDIKASTLVRRTFGPLKGALEVERGIVYQVNLDVGRLVVFAICSPELSTTSIHVAVTSNSKANLPEISLFTRRKRASMVQSWEQTDGEKDREGMED